MKMISFPKFKQLQNPDELNNYSKTYFQCSGLPIPAAYLHCAANRVYGIFHKKQMIGGFIIGQGEKLRTVEVFAQPNARPCLYDDLGDVSGFSEITCFWIAPQYRKSTSLNTFVWLCLAFTLRRFGQKDILFGTCSASLAKLYSATPESRLLHTDTINRKRTFIFRSKRQVSLKGFLEILCYKWKRQARIWVRQRTFAFQQITHLF